MIQNWTVGFVTLFSIFSLAATFPMKVNLEISTDAIESQRLQPAIQIGINEIPRHGSQTVMEKRKLLRHGVNTNEMKKNTIGRVPENQMSEDDLQESLDEFIAWSNMAPGNKEDELLKPKIIDKVMEAGTPDVNSDFCSSCVPECPPGTVAKNGQCVRLAMWGSGFN